MEFKATDYQLLNVADGHIFEDKGWMMSDPASSRPSLVRAVYAEKHFHPREDLDGIYRYADWMPVRRMLKNSCVPVTFRSEALAAELGLKNLYITCSGWNPRKGARFRTCSFKETEAYSVLARLPEDEKRVLVVQSAGNTARAFAQVASDNRIPLAVCVPENCLGELWFAKPLDSCVKVLAVPKGCDYYDAIVLGEKLAQHPDFFLEGGAKNIARRDGMGTTILSFVEQAGRIPDAYFQAVGSGTGAIAAWENACRLEADGRFGKNNMKVFVAQNAPFSLMYDAWKAHSRALPELAEAEGRHRAETIVASVLANRKPPYSLAGGLYDVLEQSGGDAYLAENGDALFWLLRYLELEKDDLLPAAAVAVAALSLAVKEGRVKADDCIMLNCTGSGMVRAKREGFVQKAPDLILDPSLAPEVIAAQVKALF